MTTTDAPGRALLTRHELADLLRVSLSTVDGLRVRGVIRPVQLVPNGTATRHPWDPFAGADCRTTVARARIPDLRP